MTVLSTLRARRSTWGRFVSGVVVLAWLNVMLQPCAMAMNVSAEVAAMPAMHQGHGQHSQHEMPAGDDADSKCSNCVTEVSVEQGPCDAVLMEDCNSLSDYNNDGRSPDPKPKDAAAIVAIVSSFEKTNFITAPRLAPALYFNRPLRSSGPTLNVRFCVYLK